MFLMLSRFLSLALFAAALALPARAADTPPPAQPAAKIDYKDAFLAFALDKAKTYSGALETTVSKAVDTATTEAPKVAEEYVRWRIWYHALHCAVPLILILGAAVIVLCLRRFPFDDCFETLGGTIRSFVGVGGLLFCLFAFFSLLVDDPPGARSRERAHLYSLVQVVSAPRIYVIEQVIDLAKR